MQKHSNPPVRMMALATAMPKGIFGNTQEIYAEVASYPVVPPEKIRQYWNVYTTTFRRLVDPSAFRLENFWWHVWGSDRRNLSGPALARLFKEFSEGPTFVPVTGPSHSDGGLLMLGLGRRNVDGTHAETTQQRGYGSGQESAQSSQSAPLDNKKAPTPSSSRPPPPHPILKKSRGPSASGPRPTARFASPPASADESSDGDVQSTGAIVSSLDMPPPPLPLSASRNEAVTPAAAAVPATEMAPPPLPSAKVKKTPAPLVVVQGAEKQTPPPVSPSRERAAAPTTRKVVATTAASKRRPVVMRRPSSHSTTGSDSSPRVAGFVNNSAKQPENKRQVPATEQLLGHGAPSTQPSEPGMTAKAAGKRPAKAATSKRPSSQSAPMQREGKVDGVETVQRPQTTGPQRRSTWDVREVGPMRGVTGAHGGAIQEPPPIHPPVAGFVADSAIEDGAPPMARSRSNNEARYRHREPGLALLPSQATSSVAMITATARGRFDSETVTPKPSILEPMDIPDSSKADTQPSSSVLLDLQFKPTPPNPAPPIPFGRTRSELTLLLEREKARKGGGA